MKSVLKFSNQYRWLTPSTLEAKILGSHLVTKEDDGWTTDAVEHGVVIDLSRVELVELGTLIQLVLLLESGARLGVNFDVLLPSPSLLESEKPWEHRLKGVPERRENVLGFLDRIQFRQALNHEHIRAYPGKIEFPKSGDQGTDPNVQQGELETPEESEALNEGFKYKNIVPLTWLSNEPDKTFTQFGRMLWGVISESGKSGRRGLESIDANALSQVLLREFSENVSMHSRECEWGLAAAWAGDSAFWLKVAKDDASRDRYAKRFVDAEQGYMAWLASSGVPFVDLIFGDSGVGVIKSLSPTFETHKPVPYSLEASQANRILLWAFDRWSSSKDASLVRGTRGLYRVDRVVKRYSGLATLRSENCLAGWDHGGAEYDSPVVSRDRLSFFKGTLLRMRMAATYQSAMAIRSLGARHPETKLLFRVADYNAEKGLTDQSREAIRQLFSRECGPTPVWLIVSLDEDGAIKDERETISRILRQVVDLRHPGVLVICGLPGGWDLIEGQIDSLNSQLQRDRKVLATFSEAGHEVWDPVLVLGGRLEEWAWAGVSDSMRVVLNELIRDEKNALSSATIQSLVPKKNDLIDIYRTFRGDTDLVSIHPDSSVRLHFSLAALSERISKLLFLRAKDAIEKGSDGIPRQTPSLRLVKFWLNTHRLVDEACGARLCGFSIAMRITRHERWKSARPTAILADGSVSYYRAKACARKLGVQDVYAMSGEAEVPTAGEGRLIENGASVVVFCDLILSAETAQRCCRQILRDGGRISMIACVYDAREIKAGRIRVWGTDVPVVSLAEADVAITAHPQGLVVNINPVTRAPERHSVIEPTEQEQQDRLNLLRVFDEAGGLQFAHFVTGVGRHYTLFIDSDRILEHPSVTHAYRDEIASWIDNGQGPDAFEIWIPEAPAKGMSAIKSLALRLQNLFPTTKEVREVSRKPALGVWRFPSRGVLPLSAKRVVIVDWGTVSGLTLKRMMATAVRSGAEQVLVCAGISQLSLEEEEFLRSLDRISVEVESSSSPAEFSFDQDAEGQTTKHSAAVKVAFLSHFSAAAYTSYECPVCEQIDRLGSEDFPTDYLSEYAHDRRLALKSSDPLSYGDEIEHHQSQSPGALVSMLELRRNLVMGLTSTARRYEVLLLLKELGAIAASEAPKDKVFWVLRFLAVESQWLKAPPLHFMQLRGLLAAISFAVVADPASPSAAKKDALLVMRSCSKLAFANYLEPMFVAVQASPECMAPLVYSIFTIAYRPYEQGIEFIAPLRQALKDIYDKRIRGQSGFDDQLTNTLERIRFRLDVEYQRNQAAELTAARAWSHIKEGFDRFFSYETSHCQLTVHMRNLLPGRDDESIKGIVEEIEKGGNPEALPELIENYFRSLEHEWSPCRDFLLNWLLPYIPRIEEQLSSYDGYLKMGKEAVHELLRLAKHAERFAEDELSELIVMLSRDPLKNLNNKNWNMFKEGVKMLRHHIFLRMEKDRSGLIDFLFSVPSEFGVQLKSVFKAVFRDLLNSGEIESVGVLDAPDQNLSIFCPQGLLREILSQIFENMIKHRSPGMPIEIRCDIQANEDFVEAHIVNSGTRQRTDGERRVGLQFMANRLSKFGGHLNYEPRSGAEWGATFYVSLQFPRMK